MGVDQGQFLPDTQIYWSAEGAAFSFRYQNNSGLSFRPLSSPASVNCVRAEGLCRLTSLLRERHVGFELRNVVANYRFERPHRFPGINSNSGPRDRSQSVRVTSPPKMVEARKWQGVPVHAGRGRNAAGTPEDMRFPAAPACWTTLPRRLILLLPRDSRAPTSSACP